MYIKGGLRFLATDGGGLHIAIQDGSAENAPVLREVIFTPSCLAELLADITPVKPKAKKARK